MPSIPVRMGDARCPCEDCSLIKNPHSKCRLTNPIHPIWRYDNLWLGDCVVIPLTEPVGAVAMIGSDGRLPPETYQRMAPALQLATLLLQRARPFLMRLMFAELLPSGVVDEAYQADSAQEAKYDAQMLVLSKTVMTCTATPSDAEACVQRKPVLYMALHRKHYEALASDWWLSADFKHRHHHLWYIAIFLVHEIAHLVWSYRVHNEWLINPRSGVLYEEPCLDFSHYHPVDLPDELGEALEHFLYQGRFMFYGEHSDRKSIETLFGSLQTDLLWSQDGLYLDNSLPQYAVVQPEAISRAFCAATWSDETTAPMELLLSPFRNFVTTHVQDDGRRQIRIDQVEYPHHDLTEKSEYTCTCRGPEGVLRFAEDSDMNVTWWMEM